LFDNKFLSATFMAHVKVQNILTIVFLLQCFEVVGWVAGRASGLLKTEW